MTNEFQDIPEPGRPETTPSIKPKYILLEKYGGRDYSTTSFSTHDTFEAAESESDRTYKDWGGYSDHYDYVIFIGHICSKG